MAQEVKRPIMNYMRNLLNQYGQLMGESKDSGSMEFWDAVVITAADDEQQSAFELQIADKISRGEIPKGLPLHVVSDPPGIRVGNGGSTLAVLEFLEKEYGDKMLHMKILLIHAGGWSQRMPSATVLGKIFSLLPHGNPPFQMLDLKLALYWPFVPKISAGIFLVCADDFLVFNLGEDDDWRIPPNGFTALAHPSNIAVGRTHGVFVISPDCKMETSKHVQILECIEVLQKPNDVRMKSQGALLKGSSHMFADGISLEGEVIYTDSCFFFGADVVEKLLKFKKSVRDLNCEIDAYGDFLQALGKNATSNYVNNISNVSRPTTNLIEMRKKVFNLLNDCDIHVLALNASTFIHIGTTKELIHHLCRDQVFQDQMAFEKDVFNLWSTPLLHPENSTGKTGHFEASNGEVTKKSDCNSSSASEFSCIVHSLLPKESSIGDDCFLEFCDFDIPIQLSKNCILSNCQMAKSQTQLHSMSIPDNTFLHSVPLCTEGKVVEYVTVFFRIDDSLKKSVDLKDVESLPFLGSDVGQYLANQGLQVGDIVLPNTDNGKAGDGKSEDKCKVGGQSSSPVKVSLWTLKLYPASPTMTASLENCVSALKSNERRKVARMAPRLYSLEDVARRKDVKAMLDYRKNLYAKIRMGTEDR